MHDYDPQPLDTSAVQLPPELLGLTEKLARNAHDHWGRQRLNEGWKFGEARDDIRRLHPCLRRYRDLPEAEKQLDRAMALETLKAILSLGYRIHPPAPVHPPETPLPTDVAAILQRLRDSARLDLHVLLDLWRAHQPKQWRQAPELYELLGRRLDGLGELLLACDVATEGLDLAPQDVRLRQLQALALAHAGASQQAKALLTRLEQEGHANPETLGLLARTYKDLGEQTSDPKARAWNLGKAYEHYFRAYRQVGQTRDKLSWNGINAATMALLLGRHAEAVQLASESQATARIELQTCTAEGRDRYWALATLGEAALILEDWAEADRCYEEAARVGEGRFGHLKSTRRNARLLLDHFKEDRQRIDRHFRIPSVVVCSGHMIDRLGRESPRFPPALEGAVRLAIRKRLATLNAGFGYASAYNGADIVFLEEMLERTRQGTQTSGSEARTCVVLPYDAELFCQDQIDVAGPGWRDRYQRVLEQAHVVAAGKHRMEGTAPAEYANLLVLGLGSIRAQQAGADLIPLVVWDGSSGGTARVVELWRRFGHEPQRIDVLELLREAGTPVGLVAREPVEEDPPLPQPEGFETRRMAILFADAVKFSELTEVQIPRFVTDFLGMVRDLLATAAQKPVIRNTWGDGLYFVFESVRDAGNFALELSARVGSFQWEEKGLPKLLSLRIALHAGAVYRCTDPVTEQVNYVGTQVSRAARIEPITPAGQVYASEEFAAMALAEQVRDFTCEYVGQTPLAKNAGMMATYHVRQLPQPM